MVSFQCDSCGRLLLEQKISFQGNSHLGDTVKKPALKKHLSRCKDTTFTCLDCSKTFDANNAHTSCVSEAEKYQKSCITSSLYKGGKSKTESSTSKRLLSEDKWSLCRLEVNATDSAVVELPPSEPRPSPSKEELQIPMPTDEVPAKKSKRKEKIEVKDLAKASTMPSPPRSPMIPDSQIDQLATSQSAPPSEKVKAELSGKKKKKTKVVESAVQEQEVPSDSTPLAPVGKKRKAETGSTPGVQPEASDIVTTEIESKRKRKRPKKDTVTESNPSKSPPVTVEQLSVALNKCLGKGGVTKSIDELMPLLVEELDMQEQDVREAFFRSAKIALGKKNGFSIKIA